MAGMMPPTNRLLTIDGQKIQVRFLQPITLRVRGAKRRYEAGETAWFDAPIAFDLVRGGVVAELVTAPADIITKAAGGIRRLTLTTSLGVCETKSVGGRRQLRAVCSTARPDRHGDVVEVAGIDAAEYLRNPIVLMHHDDRAPVAHADELRVAGDRLTATIRFPDEGQDQLSDRAWKQCELGLLKGVSVGFLPLEVKPMPGGRGVRYLKSQLLEVSLTSLPANPDCLIQPAFLPSQDADRPRLRAAKAKVEMLRASCGGVAPAAAAKARGGGDNRRGMFLTGAAWRGASSLTTAGDVAGVVSRHEDAAREAERAGRFRLAACHRSLAAAVRDAGTVRKMLRGEDAQP